jgi:hypothetical protein
MNIRDHIEAGHYPKDEKGRALVPTQDGKTVVIYATDVPFDTGDGCIAGFRPTHGLHRWHSDGNAASRSSGWTLLPPPPRKVEVKVVARIVDGEIVSTIWDVPLRIHAQQIAKQWRDAGDTVAELTGSYEEPWS